MRILLALYFFSFFTNATSCFQSEEQAAKWDATYAGQFKLNSELNKGTYSVSVSIPKTIEGQSFNVAGIIIGDEDNPSFFATLKPFKDESETKIWFLVKANPIEKNSLIFSYGDGCGISITVPIELK
ncbi:hypothetical protein [Pseudoalteromonas sp.]|uniref:hypothetical protein n=1 Tax=Pseudoalteromonas sp. TaxID=53249 RepID=UPI003003894C